MLSRSAQRLLRHRYDLPDAMKVARLRKFVRSPTVQSALQLSSDTLLAFTLRAVELVIADQSRTDREMVIPKLADPDSSCVNSSGTSIAKKYSGPMRYGHSAQAPTLAKMSQALRSLV